MFHATAPESSIDAAITAPSLKSTIIIITCLAKKLVYVCSTAELSAHELQTKTTMPEVSPI